MKFPKKRISASLYNSYKSCPLGFKLTVVDELWQKEGPALKMGSMFDLMFKILHEGKDPYEALKKKKELWSKDPTKDEIKHFTLCRKLIEEYKKNPDKFTKPEFDVYFEIPFVHPFTKEELEFPINGFLDGLDKLGGSVSGIEVKTTSENWSQERVDTEVQATMYIYYMYKKYNGIYPLNYIVFNKKTLVIERFTATRTLKDFANLFDKMKEFIQDVKDEKFDKNFNHAFYCPCRELAYI